VVLTGHSLGGALETMVACWQTWTFLAAQIALIIFGSLQECAKADQILERSKVSRFVCGRDVVASVPSGMFYRHASEKNSLGRPGGPLTDHRIRNYVEALSPAAGLITRPP